MLSARPSTASQAISLSIKSDLFARHDIPTSGKPASNLGRVFATPAKVCPKSEARFCHPCKVFPKSEARFCHPCKVFPQIRGTFLQPLQKSPPDPGHVSATPAKSSPKSEARFCHPCKIFPQIWGAFLQPLQRYAPVFRQILGLLTYSLCTFIQIFNYDKKVSHFPTFPLRTLRYLDLEIPI